MGLAKELLNDKELIEFSKEYSIAEYFMLDEESDLRLEFINGHIRAMSGGSERHNHIINNCLSLLHLHLKGKPCKVYNQSMKLDASSKRHGAYYYPDLVINCKTPHVVDNVVKHPCVTIEVLSPSTTMAFT
jgi:Uma2 family endonuclease